MAAPDAGHLFTVFLVGCAWGALFGYLAGRILHKGYFTHIRKEEPET